MLIIRNGCHSQVHLIRIVIDRVALQNRHRVVRLLPYHCQYNAIGLIWGQMMSDIAEKNIFQMADLEPLVNVAMGSITTENWANAVK